MNTLFKNGTIVNSTGEFKADVYIKEGIIDLIGKNIIIDEEHEVIDCNNKYILPGFIDAHFHSRVPGNTDREDFDTATKAAASNGVTSLIEMPIAKPNPWNSNNFNKRVEYARDRAYIDFGFYAAGGNLSEESATELAEAGALGYKIFLHDIPMGREDEFKNMCITNNEDLYISLLNNAKTGLLTAVHCEDDGLLKGVRKKYNEDKMSYLSQLKCRISEAEALAVLNLGMIAKVADSNIHICHVSSKDAVEAIRYLKAQGVKVTAETCPPYFLFDQSLLRKFGGLVKVNPPFKGGEHSRILKEALKSGELSIISSDHAPFLTFEKDNDRIEFLDLPAGMPSIELFGISMIDEVINGGFSLPEIVKLMSTNPATLYGLYPKKGSLNIGSDGDIVIIDLEGKTIIDIEKLYSKSRKSLLPFSYKEYKGRIEKTYVRGNLIFDNGTIVGTQGIGEFLKGPRYKSIQ